MLIYCECEAHEANTKTNGATASLAKAFALSLSLFVRSLCHALSLKQDKHTPLLLLWLLRVVVAAAACSFYLLLAEPKHLLVFLVLVLFCLPFRLPVAVYLLLTFVLSL